MLGFFEDRKETPRLGTLRQLSLFATLSRLELRVVDGLLHERRYMKGEIIFDEGEEGQTRLRHHQRPRADLPPGRARDAGGLPRSTPASCSASSRCSTMRPARRRRGRRRTACWPRCRAATSRACSTRTR